MAYHPKAARRRLLLPSSVCWGSAPAVVETLPWAGWTCWPSSELLLFVSLPHPPWMKEIQHKTGRENLPSCKSESEEKAFPFSGSNTLLNPPSSAAPGAAIVFGVALGSLPAWSGLGATGWLPAASSQQAFRCELYGFLHFHPSNCTVSVCRSKFDWSADCFVGC